MNSGCVTFRKARLLTTFSIRALGTTLNSWIQFIYLHKNIRIIVLAIDDILYWNYYDLVDHHVSSTRYYGICIAVSVQNIDFILFYFMTGQQFKTVLYTHEEIIGQSGEFDRITRHTFGLCKRHIFTTEATFKIASIYTTSPSLLPWNVRIGTVQWVDSTATKMSTNF